jgi:2-(1,2-epoxy-1,2-dihydrophenyl)acetyl-CoA isomerase
MEYKNIEAKTDGGVAVITIKRAAKGNTLTLETYDEIADAVRAAGGNAEVGAILLSGEGSDFSLGVDVGVLDALAPLSDEEKLGVMRRVQELALSIHNCAKPVIAKVRGRAMGAGCDLALVCDIIIAEEAASFGEMYVNLALVPDGGGTWLVPRLVGLARAKEMIFTGRNIDAREAERIGLINYAMKAEELDEFAAQFARKLAKGPSEAIAASKKAIHKALGLDLEAALRAEAAAQIEMFKTEKHKKRVKAFLRVQK